MAARKYKLIAFALRDRIDPSLPMQFNQQVKSLWSGSADEDTRVLIVKISSDHTAGGTYRIPFEMARFYRVSGAVADPE